MERRAGSVAASDAGGIVLDLQDTLAILDHSEPLPPTDLISVVVPAFNEERNIPKIYEAVRAALAADWNRLLAQPPSRSIATSSTADYRLLDRVAI